VRATTPDPQRPWPGSSLTVARVAAQMQALLDAADAGKLPDGLADLDAEKLHKHREQLDSGKPPAKLRKLPSGALRRYRRLLGLLCAGERALAAAKKPIGSTELHQVLRDAGREPLTTVRLSQET
jgi:hypothetical protein